MWIVFPSLAFCLSLPVWRVCKRLSISLSLSLYLPGEGVAHPTQPYDECVADEDYTERAWLDHAAPQDGVGGAHSLGRTHQQAQADDRELVVQGSV